MQTEADKRIEKARELIHQAIDELSMVVISRCSGWEEYKSAYYSFIRDQMFSLIAIRDEWERRD